MKTITISEAEFQKQVTELAHLRRWRVASFRRVRVQRKSGAVYWETPVGADGKGWPDLVLCRGIRLIFAELKIGKNKTTPEQVAWLDSLAMTGAETYIWRPEDWAEIERVIE